MITHLQFDAKDIAARLRLAEHATKLDWFSHQGSNKSWFKTYGHHNTQLALDHFANPHFGTIHHRDENIARFIPELHDHKDLKTPGAVPRRRTGGTSSKLYQM